MPRLPGRVEFVALIATLFATIAFSIDAMLPALPQLAETLSPDAPNRAQLVVTSFVLGMGIGTLFTGPLSDRFGRKPVILCGVGLYLAGSVAATLSGSLEMLLAARMVQGLGAAGPRVVALAIIRDLYAGRGMARILSFVMLVFSIIPAIAPSVGAAIIAVAGWRAIFWAFVLFASISAFWLWIRLPETLAVADRRPFKAKAMLAAIREMLTHPVVRLSIAVQGFSFGTLFAMISTVQPIFDVQFGRADSFPLWFGGIAIVAASASFVNAALVMRLGMQALVRAMLTVQVAISALMVITSASGVGEPVHFAVFLLWMTSVFFQAGMTLGNLNAIAMEPMGHIAGMAASVIGAIATVLAVVLAVPLALLFDGTPLPLACGILIFSVAGLILMRAMARAQTALNA